MTIEERRHADILSRLDTLSTAVVALCEALKGKEEDEEGEEEDVGCEGIRAVLVWDPVEEEVMSATMEEET